MSTTPILDLEQALPPTRKRRWARTILVYSIAALVITAINVVWELSRSDAPDPPEVHSFTGWLVLPALYFAILIHELGHLAAGKLAGMKPGGICVGGIIFLNSGERWIVRFQPQYLFGGFAVPLPSKLDFQRARQTTVNASPYLAETHSTTFPSLR